MPSKGRLSLFLRDINVDQLAKEAGVSVGFVSHCLAGRKKASPKLVAAAERLALGRKIYSSTFEFNE